MNTRHPHPLTDSSTPDLPCDQSTAQVRQERRISIALSLLAFIVSYILTAGPAVFLVTRFKLPVYSRIVEVLYSPLILIVKSKVPLLSPLIKAWVDLFR